MLDKKGIQNCLYVLVLVLLVGGIISQKENYNKTVPSSQSQSKEGDFDNKILKDYFQESEVDVNFATGLEMYNQFYSSVYSVCNYDDLVYICTNQGVKIYNCENISDLDYVGTLLPSSYVSNIKIMDFNISIIRRSASLFIYNISNFELPELIFEFSERSIYWYEIKNDQLIFYSHNFGFFVYDISDPYNPVEIYFEPVDIVRYLGVILDNNTVILADQYSCELYFYNASNFVDIELLTVFQDSSSSAYSWDRIVAKDDIFIIDKYSVKTIYTYENLSAVEALFSFESSSNEILNYANERLYLETYDMDFGSKIEVFNLTNPKLPVKIGESEYYKSWNSFSSILDNGILSLVTSYDIIYFINITNPNFIEFKSVIVSGYVSSICIFQNLLYATTSYANGLQIFNISNPFSPFLEKTILLNHTTKQMKFHEKYLIFSSEDTKLYFYDLSNPMDPILSQIFTFSSTSGETTNFEIKNNAIFAILSGELFILDIEIISNPTEIFHLSLSHNSISKIAIGDNVVAIYSYYFESIYLYDYSDKQDIHLISEISCGYLYDSNDMVISNNMLIFTYQYRKLRFFDISNPANPTMIQEKESYVNCLAVLEDYLIVVEGYEVVRIYNINSVVPELCFTFKKYFTSIILVDDDVVYFRKSFDISSLGIDSDSDLLIDSYEQNVFCTDSANPDTDNDDMTDYFESFYNLDPLNLTDRDLDYDKDSLTNYEESLQFSDPFKVDTDSDLLSDFEEFHYQTNPILSDTDSDNLSDFNEISLYFTDPLVNDTDQDKLLDGIEILSSFTNPLEVDTDMDEMDDWWEYVYQLNPLDSNDKLGDLDLDGLSNIEEYFLGTLPNASDSDGDGFTDKNEIELGTDPMDQNDFPSNNQEKSSISLLLIVIISFGVFSKVNFHKKKNWSEK